MTSEALKDFKAKSFPALKNDCIIKAALGEKTKFVPVWVMRQAGRYLPEFRALRKENSFFEICETPELACEVSLMPLKHFDLDAAIIFSDILVIPQALGMTVLMTSEGPKFPEPLEFDCDLKTKLIMDVDISKRLIANYKAITMTRLELNGRCPLIGFTGAPWTLMCYMIEGGGSKTMSKAKKWLYQDRNRSHQLLDIIATKVTDHLVEQAKAGAQLLQLFESNAEYLTLDLFQEFAYPYIARICSQVKERLSHLGIARVPIIVFAKGGHHTLDVMAQSKDIDVLSLDWTIDPKKVREITSLTLQGNLDPVAMNSTPGQVSTMVAKMLDNFGTQNYIANLGHGIYPESQVECVKTFVDSVHEISIELNDLIQS